MKRPPRSAGFTLVEVLIGTTLLGVMVSLLMSALFVLSRNAGSGEERLEEIDATRLVQAFLRRQLAQARPLTEQVGRENHVLFDGRRDRLLFVGHLPAYRSGGGLQFMGLTVETTAEERSLVLHHRQVWADSPFSLDLESDAWTEEVLVSEVDTLRLSYFGRKNEEAPPAWTDAWSELDRLPALVKIELERSGDRLWPPLVAAVRTQTADGQRHLFRVGRRAGQ